MVLGNQEAPDRWVGMAGMLCLGKNIGSLEWRRGGWMLGALRTLLMTVWRLGGPAVATPVLYGADTAVFC